MAVPGVITILEEGSASEAPTYAIKLKFASLGSYATGGISLSALIAGALGAGAGRSINVLDIVGGRSFSGTYYTLTYDNVNDLAQVWDAAGAEVANATNLTGEFRMLVLGT